MFSIFTGKVYNLPVIINTTFIFNKKQENVDQYYICSYLMRNLKKNKGSISQFFFNFNLKGYRSFIYNIIKLLILDL